MTKATSEYLNRPLRTDAEIVEHLTSMTRLSYDAANYEGAAHYARMLRDLAVGKKWPERAKKAEDSRRHCIECAAQDAGLLKDDAA